jgi:hypothetical protein
MRSGRRKQELSGSEFWSAVRPTFPQTVTAGKENLLSSQSETLIRLDVDLLLLSHFQGACKGGACWEVAICLDFRMTYQI